MKLKLRKVGAAVGVILPDEMLARLKVKAGDMLLATETGDGYLLTRYDAEIEEQLKLGREVMDNHRETLRGLSKLNAPKD